MTPSSHSNCSTPHLQKSYFELENDRLFTLSIVCASINAQSFSISKVAGDCSGRSRKFHGPSRRHELIGLNRHWTEDFGRQLRAKVTNSCFTVWQNSCGDIIITERERKCCFSSNECQSFQNFVAIETLHISKKAQGQLKTVFYWLLLMEGSVDNVSWWLLQNNPIEQFGPSNKWKHSEEVLQSRIDRKNCCCVADHGRFWESRNG